MQNSDAVPSKPIQKHVVESSDTHLVDYQKRRRIDIVKRFKALQARRERLEKELDSVRATLLALDREFDLESVSQRFLYDKVI